MKLHTTSGQDPVWEPRPASQDAKALCLAIMSGGMVPDIFWPGGASIPFEGRIVALADNLDALLSENRIKRAWTLEAAVDAIKKPQGQAVRSALTDVLMGLTETTTS